MEPISAVARPAPLRRLFGTLLACPGRNASATKTLPRRTFSSISGLRPGIAIQPRAAGPAFSSPFPPSRPALQSAPTVPRAADGAPLDLVAKSAISAHPALAGLQIRCGPRSTMQNNSRLIRQRRHGFLVRLRTAKGRKIIMRRRLKGRKRLGAY